MHHLLHSTKLFLLIGIITLLAISYQSRNINIYAQTLNPTSSHYKSITAAISLFVITSSIQLISSFIGYNARHSAIAAFQILIYIINLAILLAYVLDSYSAHYMWTMWYAFGITTLFLELLILLEYPFQLIVQKATVKNNPKDQIEKKAEKKNEKAKISA